MTITRHNAAHLHDAVPELVEFTESILCSLPVAPAETHEDIVAQVRAGLRELSARHRRVVTLHYLDGYSCKEIGVRLALPAGTVKRILHESRNALRAQLGVSDISELTKRRSKQMEKHTAKRSAGPRQVWWWVWGWGRFSLNRLQLTILLTINKEDKSLEQIAREVGAHADYVEEALQPLLKDELVVQTAPGKYLSNFIMLDGEDWQALTADAHPRAAAMADLLAGKFSVLEEAWHRTTLPAQGVDWREGMWITLAVFIANLGASRQPPLMPPLPLHSNGDHFSAGWPRSRRDEPGLWNAGFNMNASPLTDFRLGFFNSIGFRRIHLISSRRRFSNLRPGSRNRKR